MQLSVEHIKKEQRNTKKAIKDTKTENSEDKHQTRWVKSYLDGKIFEK